MDIKDLMDMKGDELLALYEKIIKAGRCNVTGEDRVLYQQIKIELEARLNGVYAGRNPK